jgi:4-methyl-5(b-hydroxyethyl)-thiazole monophosphate biosynthesis
MKKANIYLAEGFEEIEAVTVIDVLRRAGLEVHTVAVSRQREVMGVHHILVAADKSFEEHDNSAADLLVLPGGMPGTANLEQHEGLRALIREFYESGKYIGAICAAPSILGKLGILEGAQATCFPGFEAQLKGAECSGKPVVQHKNIITSRGAGTAMLFALKLVELLAGPEKAAELKQQLLVQEEGNK